MDTDAFSFEYTPAAIEYGRGRAADLGDVVRRHGGDRALVVCGHNTGANDALMTPIDEGLGQTHVDSYVGTTPDKRLETAAAVAARAEETDADVFVPVGGGSSLDVATVASVLRAGDRALAEVRETVAETGGIPLPDDTDRLTPLVPVPTTLAGADLSTLAGITVELDDRVVATGVGDPALMPAAVLYDPALFETTPRRVLAGSAMNGFDKALESTYAANGTPLTDATARRAVAYLDDGLSRLFGDGDEPSASSDRTDRDDDADRYDSDAVDRAVAGVVLAQYGISRPDGTTLNVLHAFGHALRDTFGVQQGVGHAVIAPAALRAMTDAGVDLDPLVDAFGVADVTAVVERVETIRAALDLPTEIRTVTAFDAPADDERVAAALDEAAAATAADSLAANAPPALDLDAATARRVLEAAW
ncbi:iron-containing alcohol dehydrogenase [Halobaculum sp. MBLA0147]|uniref:iron-containing alcohol dehydrogenase n=1 Tax=Halobaculum sp. MBLA0147 TaxID=3079934 RepID=UPI003524E2E3